MNKKQFANIVKAINSAYMQDRLFSSEETIEFWYRAFGDCDYILLEKATMSQINKSKFPPTIAELKSAYDDQYKRFKKLYSETYDYYSNAIGDYVTIKRGFWELVDFTMADAILLERKEEGALKQLVDTYEQSIEKWIKDNEFENLRANRDGTFGEDSRGYTYEFVFDDLPSKDHSYGFEKIEKSVFTYNENSEWVSVEQANEEWNNIFGRIEETDNKLIEKNGGK